VKKFSRAADLARKKEKTAARDFPRAEREDAGSGSFTHADGEDKRKNCAVIRCRNTVYRRSCRSHCGRCHGKFCHAGGCFKSQSHRHLSVLRAPRVIKQTIGKDLPKGFQRSEFLLEKGFLDMVVHRKELKQTITKVLQHLNP